MNLADSLFFAWIGLLVPGDEATRRARRENYEELKAHAEWQNAVHADD